MKRIYLDVPFEVKNTAKKAGCRWDSDLRKWYYPCESLDDLPEVLRQFLPANAEVVEDPQLLLRKAKAEARQKMLEMAPAAHQALLTKLIEAGPVMAKQSWTGDQDEQTIYDRVLTRYRDEGLAELRKWIEDWPFLKDTDPESNLDYLHGNLFMRMLSEASEAAWNELTTPLREHYFDCLDNWDMDILPHGEIEAGMVFEQGDTRIVFGHCNMMPCIHSVEHKGKLLYANEYGKAAILYNGKHVHTGDMQSKFQAFNRTLRERHIEAAERVLADVKVNDRCARSVQGENYTLTTEDGRIITGFFADDEYYIYTLDGKNVGSCPAKDKLCERIRDVFLKKT